MFGLYYGYSGIRSLFFDELGRSAAVSDLAGVVGAFFYAFLWVPMLWLTLSSLAMPNRMRQLVPIFALWLVFYGSTPVLKLWLGSNVCFDQATGEPLKWFTKAPDGTLTLYDAPGFDPSGLAKQPVTSQICRIVKLQAEGIHPQRISNDVSRIEFFDPTSGSAKVWYSVDSDGSIRFFNAEGFDPGTGALLKPVTDAVIGTAKAQASAAKEAAQRASAAEAEKQRQAAQDAAARAQAAAEQKRHAALVSAFSPGSYSSGVVILGGAPADQSEFSQRALEPVLNALGASVRAKGLTTDRLRPAVYASGQFDALFHGDKAALVEVELAAKMRSAVLLTVSANCQRAASVTGVRSCTATTKVRVLSMRNNLSIERDQTVTGAGATDSQALQRAAEMLNGQYPSLLEGV